MIYSDAYRYSCDLAPAFSGWKMSWFAAGAAAVMSGRENGERLQLNAECRRPGVLSRSYIYWWQYFQSLKKDS
jgi:hypothetical protein